VDTVEDRDSWMLIGRVSGAFGVRGEMKVEPLTDFPERFLQLERIYLGPQRREHAVERARLHKSQVLLTLPGIESPEAVAVLRGHEIAIPRKDAVALPEGHYYLEDILGVMVLTTEGVELGTISDVIRTGSNDVYVINEGSEAVLVPATRDAIHHLDLEAKRVIIEPWVLLPEL
jgi:16S rRNA processing protein RimM